VLAGKYRIDGLLASGGMGVILVARHLQLDQRVAIKVLKQAALESPDVVARFSREARAAVKVQGEHVARVLDVGTLESGAPYMVMEYLRGSDLSQVLRDKGPLPISDAVDYVLQACEALAEAHAIGIVHRDLKPANMFLTRRADGTPLIKLLDFGISKFTTKLDSSEKTEGLTTTSMIMGSPHYMSPEQLRSARTVDGRSDIWALGVTLYKLLSGKNAFDAETTPELCVTILLNPPAPLRVHAPHVPVELERVILRCLEKEAEHRFPNVAELTRALAPFASPSGAVSTERILRMESFTGPVSVAPPARDPSRTTTVDEVVRRLPEGAKVSQSTVVGAVFGLSAKSKADEANAYCDGPACDAPGLPLRDDARTAASISTVSFVVGGIALAAGGLVFFTAPRSQSRVSLGGSCGDAGCGATVGARF
jgi:serine/threonine-protein kinase